MSIWYGDIPVQDLNTPVFPCQLCNLMMEQLKGPSRKRCKSLCNDWDVRPLITPNLNRNRGACLPTLLCILEQQILGPSFLASSYMFEAPLLSCILNWGVWWAIPQGDRDWAQPSSSWSLKEPRSGYGKAWLQGLNETRKMELLTEYSHRYSHFKRVKMIQGIFLGSILLVLFRNLEAVRSYQLVYRVRLNSSNLWRRFLPRDLLYLIFWRLPLS